MAIFLFVGTTAAIGLGIAAASTAASTGMALRQAHEGREMRREAEKDLSEYKRQQLQNVYAGMTVPMEGFRLREEQLEQQMATGVGALSGAGARGLVGGIPALMQQGQMTAAQIGADLEQSQFKIQQMIAQDEARIQSMQERREEQDIAGLGAQIQAGRQQKYAGYQGAISSVGQLGGALVGMGGEASGVTPSGTSLNKQQMAGMGNYASQFNMRGTQLSPRIGLMPQYQAPYQPRWGAEMKGV